MKKTILLSAIIFLSISAKADWGNVYHLRLTIETANGKTGNGYALVSVLDTGKLENAEYLKQVLYPQLDEGFFRDRIEYEYQREETGQKASAYYLTNETDIPLPEDIKTIKIDEIIAHSPFISISGKLQLSDTVWMKKEPLRKVSVYGYLCNHFIYIHCYSEKTEDIINQLEAKKKGLGIILENDTDAEIRRIIEKLNGKKVVVVSECTD